MKRSPFHGTCAFCQERLAKVAVIRHLSCCSQRPKGDRGVFHVIVESSRTAYWLHVEVDARAMLMDLDHFLRETWLECCGHLSAFTIERIRYTSHPEGSDDRGMEVPLEKILKPGVKIVYEYDFGSTTELSVRVISEGKGPGEDPPILLLARNDPPAFSCMECGNPSTLVCTQCACSEEAALCKKCAKEHECGEEMLLPLVNSPRAGVCGYAG